MSDEEKKRIINIVQNWFTRLPMTKSERRKALHWGDCEDLVTALAVAAREGTPDVEVSNSRQESPITDGGCDDQSASVGTRGVAPATADPESPLGGPVASERIESSLAGTINARRCTTDYIVTHAKDFPFSLWQEVTAEAEGAIPSLRQHIEVKRQEARRFMLQASGHDEVADSFEEGRMSAFGYVLALLDPDHPTARLQRRLQRSRSAGPGPEPT
jgi:hypothetical protein